MKKPEFLNFKPVYDPRPYEKVPKVRGVFVSLVISFVVWIVAAHILAAALFGAFWLLGMILYHNSYVPDDKILCYGSLLLFDVAGDLIVLEGNNAYFYNFVVGEVEASGFSVEAEASSGT